MLEEVEYDEDAAGTESDSSEDSSSPDTSHRTLIHNATSGDNNITTTSNITSTDTTNNVAKDNTKTNVANKTENNSVVIATVEQTDVEESTGTTTATIETTSEDTSPSRNAHDSSVSLRTNIGSNGKVPIAKKEAIRLSAKLGHVMLVDSVVVRKRARDRAFSQGELYNEIGKLVTEESDHKTDEKDEVGDEQPLKNKHNSVSSDDSDAGINAEPAQDTRVKKDTGSDNKKQEKHLATHATRSTEDTFHDIVIEIDDTHTEADKQGRISKYCCCLSRRKI